MPTAKARASDATDAEVIKGGGRTPGATEGGPPSGAKTSAPSSDPAQDDLQKGTDSQGNAVATENANRSNAPQGASSTTAATQSPGSTNAALSSSSPVALQVTTITHTIGELPADAEHAMQLLKADFTAAYHIVHNVGHYSALPVEELGRLIAKVSTWMGVIRATK